MEITAEDLQVIEVRASVLTLDECFQYLLVDKEDISDEDLAIANKVWKRGRLASISAAGDKLFASMAHKGGAQPAFDYLRQMSATFQAEITPAPKSSGFKFNVVIDD
ncbi:MAG: hypothetical protein GY745_16710 [Actinomycetia bacterium]|nr:hypothetical protein [Actinomycetes bacterium]